MEDHDVTASDSRLLVHLKSMKGTVPVPRHWSQKRKYLQGKQGTEKSPYQLPDSILGKGRVVVCLNLLFLTIILTYVCTSQSNLHQLFFLFLFFFFFVLTLFTVVVVVVVVALS